MLSGLTFSKVDKTQLEEAEQRHQKRPKDKKSKSKHKKDKHKHKHKRSEERQRSSSPEARARSTDIASRSPSPVHLPGGYNEPSALTSTPSGSPPPDGIPAAKEDEFSALFGAGPAKRGTQPQEKQAPAAPVMRPGLTVVGGGAAAKPGTAPVVGDGGASWRMKALKRAQERAKAEGKHLEDEVRQRFSSTAELTASLNNARVASSHSHLAAAKARRGGSDTPDAPRRRAYLQEEAGLESRMKRAQNTDAAAAFRSRRDGRDGCSAHSTGVRTDNDGRQRQMADQGAHGSARRQGSGATEGRGRRLGAEDTAVLASANAAVNRFSDDGSFLKRFEDAAAQAKALDAAAAAAPEGSEREARRADGAGGSEHAHAAAPAGGRSANFGAAAALRARLRGQAVPEPEVSVLPAVDAAGRAAPGSFGREAAGARTAPGDSGKRNLQRYAAGEKVRYFADDDQADLDTLVKRARHGDDLHDLDAALASNIAYKARYKGNELDVDDEYDVDGGLEMFEDRSRKGSREQQQERAQRRAVSDAKRMNTALDRCAACFASPACNKSLVISVGQTVYLALPERGRLADGHCVILPMEHLPSFRDVDEHVFEELKNFKKCLIRMCEQQGKNCVFIETALKVKDMHTHARVECIPVDDDVFARAPMVFKQEIGESESEWSTHHAKRLLDTSEKGLRRSIPQHFPYFHVEFGYRRGFVHVIDDEVKWKRNFGRSVMVGLMGLRDEDMYRRAQRESRVSQEETKAEFMSSWSAFDWTLQLDD